MLSSLIQYTGKRKVAMNFRLRSNSNAHRHDRTETPPSPKSFVSPELFEISSSSSHYTDRSNVHHIQTQHEHTQNQHEHQVEDAHQLSDTRLAEPEFPRESVELEESEESVAVITQRAPCVSPRVQLEIDTGPLEWFPPDLLNSDAFNVTVSQPEVTNPGAIGNVSEISLASRGEVPPGAGTGHDPENSSNDKLVAENVILDDSSRTSSNVGADTHNRHESHAPSSFVKPSTSAIQIPNPLHRNSQISHNSESAVDNMSSVSGTTLARALIGNTFVLSNDYRLSRNRTGLTRQDSTTLPRNGDHTHRRGRRTPSPSSSIPPVPPVPVELLPHVRKRRSSAPENFLDAPPQPEHQSSAASLKSIVASYGAESPTPDVEKHEVNDTQFETNISHPPESQPSPPSAPRTPPAPPNAPLPISANNSTASLAHSATTEKTSSSKSSGSAPPLSLSNPKRPSLTLHHRTLSEPKNMPLSATSSVGVDSAFAGFEFASPVRSPLASAAFSEIMSGSSFSLTPYVGESPNKRESKKRQQLGLGMAPSPVTPRGKVDWILPRHGSTLLSPENTQSRTASYLPIGDRPRSLLPSQASVRPTDPASSTPPSLASAPSSLSTRRVNNNMLTPGRGMPGRQGVFNRQRSGSTPNPIMVTRDSQDFNTYNITVSTAAEPDADINTPGLSGSQTFPETPYAFSPVWSASSASSPLRMEAGEFMLVGSAAEITRSTSMSASISSSAGLAQHVLLTRAATSVRGARAGLTRPRLLPAHPYARNNMSVLLTPPPEEPIDMEVSPTKSEEVAAAASSSHGELSVIESAPSFQSGPSTPHSQASSNQSGMSLESGAMSQSPSPSPNSMADMANGKPTSGGNRSPSAISKAVPSMETLLLETNLSFDKPLPPMPPVTPDTIPDPAVDTLSSDSPTPDAQFNGPAVSGTISQDVTVVPSIPLQPMQTPPQPQLVTPLSPRSLPQPGSSQAARVAPLPAPIFLPPAGGHSPGPERSRRFPPTPQTPSFLSTRQSSGTNSLTLSLGAPPPYYSVVPVNGHGPSPLPVAELKASSASSHSDGSSQAASPSYTVSPPANTSHSTSSVVTPDSSPRHQRTGRMRPPLPVGPRKPIHHSGSFSSIGVNSLLERNASTSSSNGGINTGASVGSLNGRARAFSNASSSVPKFQTHPVKWRGYTMDAAKWTFTSSQLQGIVSRAIRQSAEASSIRLLQLETLDNDLPDEMHRLEMLGMDTKSRYKTLSRKRWALLATLSAQLQGPEIVDPAAVSRIVDELAEVSATLDQLADELHSVDEQISQLKSLRDIHSASALSMALRKLNSSFLKQLGETQALRAQVETLEAERDEAWKQAEDVANDYDDLTENMKVPDAASPSTPGSAKFGARRSSRVMAVRKSSLRVSKAGLRPPRSQRSSVSSTCRTSVSSSSAVRSAFHSGIPPVPPMPRQTPLGIVTADLPSRVSTGLSSGSPSSETKAMVKVQDELYAMLGIPLDSGSHIRRPRSMSGAGEAEPSPVTTEAPLTDSRRPSNSRPLSFPGTVGVGSVLADDRQAILATLGLMSG